MFPYFGRKGAIAKAYPEPTFDLVIEPFAGSLAYSCFHRPKFVLGVEKDERVVALWNQMTRLTDVPVPPALGSSTSDLLVKLCSYSEHALLSESMTVTSRMLRDWQSVHRKALLLGGWATNSVLYRQGSYKDAPDIEATWFIDPPYQKANRRGYKYGAGSIDFIELGEWVQTRRGQVIVCEQDGADWLPFEPLVKVASHRGSISHEVIFLK